MDKQCEGCLALYIHKVLTDVNECRYTKLKVGSIPDCPCKECILKIVCIKDCEAFIDNSSKHSDIIYSYIDVTRAYLDQSFNLFPHKLPSK